MVEVPATGRSARIGNMGGKTSLSAKNVRRQYLEKPREIEPCLKPNSITLAGTKLVANSFEACRRPASNQLRTSSEPASNQLA